MNKMRIIILTQAENLYLPQSFAIVCKELRSEIVCIVTSPAMSTHGGAFKGLVRHFRLFGLKGTFIMALRVIKAGFKARFAKPAPEGPFYSIRQVAERYEIPFFHLKTIKSPSFMELLDKYQPELLISISCPQIIGKNIREKLPKGCINVHGSPLPRYRGLMPAFWVLRNGESTTAVTVHDLQARLDDGDILIQKEVAITPEETWDSLVRKTKREGAYALLEAVEQIRSGSVQRRANNADESTYFSFPTAADRRAFLKLGRSFF